MHAFLNTLDRRSFVRRGAPHRGGDRIATRGQLADWLAGHGLLPPGTAVDGPTLDRVHLLRARLRAAVGGSTAPPPDAGDPLRLTFALNAPADRAPALAPAGRAGERALGELVLHTLRAVTSGSWERLKMCQAPDCHWVFYDRSRPNRARWCAPELCGNRMKTRAYRRRARG